MFKEHWTCWAFGGLRRGNRLCCTESHIWKTARSSFTFLQRSGQETRAIYRPFLSTLSIHSAGTHPHTAKGEGKREGDPALLEGEILP